MPDKKTKKNLVDKIPISNFGRGNLRHAGALFLNAAKAVEIADVSKKH